ncbi:MAG: M14 family zinc carboxypeptidase [Ignavibacteriales bacterium]|nr:M14 family zinc carboxypeptidase [Ignavibacteriales bacterium]
MTTLIQPAAQNIARELFDSYDSFKAAEIISCRITHAEMMKWLRSFKEQNLFTKMPLGTSGEGRTISLYSIGTGLTKAMLWSQMHGDEPTATMALIDIFNFFTKHPDHIVTNTIREKLNLLMIPMLNPDGAERFTRRTAQLVDLNRDALALETPEARILKEACIKYQPEYGFNLHDQDTRLTVGTTKKITAIALLAPSTDESRSDTPVRIRAKKVASICAQILALFIPGFVAKWDDTFEPRAFGDNIQKWGTSTVLVESGGWKGDLNKFFIRKLNCIALLTTLYAIATGESAHADTAVYEQIPFNMKLGCDHIIRNAVLQSDNQTAPIRVDVGINFETRRDESTDSLEQIATIVEVGDLSTFTALEEDVDAKGAELEAKRIKLDHSFSANELSLLLKHK